MNSKLLVSIAIFGTLLFAQVFGRPQEAAAQNEQARQMQLPAWVSEALQNTPTENPVFPPSGATGNPVIPAAGATTRRPQVGDQLGQILQGLFQGLVRAPGQIASRVQQVIDGIIRRPSATPAPIPAVPIAPAPISPTQG